MITDMKFTGEYCIPGASPKRIEDDHVERYRFAAQFVSAKTVLDIACGVGYGSKLLADAGASKVDGVDISKELIEYAKRNYHAENVSFRVADICEYKVDRLYDVIACFETIEHVEDYESALSNLRSLLANAGLLLISSPNRIITSPHAKSIKDKPSNMHHVREFTIEELKSALERRGLLVNESDVFGQRGQRHFRNRLVRRIYKMLRNPEERPSPAVARVSNLAPRNFVIVARKPERGNTA